MKSRAFLVGLVVLALGVSANAQIRSPQDHLGFRVGDDYKLAGWEQITTYFEELGRSSDRIRTETVGETTLGRPFLVVTITSPENQANLDRYQEITRRLIDPRGLSEAEAEQLIGEGKSVIAITCSIHSTEVAASQMSMELAYNLATGTSETIQDILDKVIFVLVPSLNPDGVDIVGDWYRANLDTEYANAPLPELYHHYAGHDNNRDWYMFTQAETRHTIEHVYRRWHPQVLYDVHQMGNSGARLFVPPFIDPYEPNIDPILIQGAAFIGQAMMNKLIGEGKTGVVTNAIYDAWTPARAYQHYHGVVRVLSEAASVRIASPIRQSFDSLRPGRGYDPKMLSWRFPALWEGGEWKLRDIVDYELTAAMGALEHMAAYRERWLRNFHAVGKRAIAPKEGPYAFVVPPDQRDPVTTAEMLGILQFGEVEVHRARAAFTADGVEYPPDTYVIPLAQPFGSFAKTMLEKQVYPDLREYPGGPPARPYDVVGHTLPIQMGVNVVTVDDAFDADLEEVAEVRPPAGSVEGGPAEVAYLLGHETNASIKAMNRLMSDGIDVLWAAESFELGGERYAVGTMIVPAEPGVDAAVRTVARDSSVTFTGVDEALDIQAYRMNRPRIGLYASYRASMDEGWTRFIFENYDIPFVRVFDQDIRSGQLRDRYDVLVIPAELSENAIIDGYRQGSIPPQYAGGMGEQGVEYLRQFINEGGTLVALDDAADFAINQFALPVENVLDGVGSRDFFVPGSLLKAVLDTNHPIAYGLERESPVFFRSNGVFEVGEGVRSVARYPLTNPLLSGWVLGEERLFAKTAVADVPVGDGRVVLFAIRPQFRAQIRVTYKLLFNSLYFGSADLTRFESTSNN